MNLVGFATPKVFCRPMVDKLFDGLKNLKFYHYLNRGDIVPLLMPGQYDHPKSAIVRHFDPFQIDVIDRRYTSKVSRDSLNLSHTVL